MQTRIGVELSLVLSCHWCWAVIGVELSLVLSTHHLRVWLDIAYSTGVESYYFPERCI